MRTSFEIGQRLLLLAVLLVAPAMLSAQDDDGPAFISVRFVDVKPDAGAQFEAAIKDIGQSLRSGGAPFFHVYQRMRGDMGYTIITQDRAYANQPAIEISPTLITRVTSTLNSTRLVTLAIYPELSITGDSVEPEGEFMHVRVRTTSPANRQGFFDWQKNELVPALRKAGATNRRAGRVVAGGNVNTFVDFSYSKRFPQGEVNLPQAMGQRNFDQMISRANNLTAAAEDYRYRFRSDLSFTAPPQ